MKLRTSGEDNFNPLIPWSVLKDPAQQVQWVLARGLKQHEGNGLDKTLGFLRLSSKTAGSDVRAEGFLQSGAAV